MKVVSKYAFNLPGNVPLPKGESVVGEMPEAARKFLNELISGGSVVVLADAPKAEPSKVSEAPKSKSYDKKTTEKE